MYILSTLRHNISMKKNFILCGLAGWCMEVLWTGLGSIVSRDPKLTCRTSVWMFPIYGLAAFLSPISRRLNGKNTFFRGGLYTLLIFATRIHHWCGSEKISPLPMGLQRTACKCPWIDQPVLHPSVVWRRFVFRKNVI